MWGGGGDTRGRFVCMVQAEMSPIKYLAQVGRSEMKVDVWFIYLYYVYVRVCVLRFAPPL